MDDSSTLNAAPSKQPPTDSGATPARKSPIASVFEICFCAFFGLMAAILILTPPALGLANNGDFRRITTNLGFESMGDTASRKDFVDRYKTVTIDHPDHLNLISRIAVLSPIKVARAFTRLRWKSFDLRALGAIYVLLSTLAMGLWIRATRGRSTWRRVLLGAAYCFVFLDLGYLVYFGSFYTEPPSMVYLLCALGCLLNFGMEMGQTRSRFLYLWIVGFLGFCVVFAVSKAQNTPLVVPLVVAGTLAVFWTQSRARLAVTIALALLAIGLVVKSARDYDHNLRDQNSINSVFHGLLLDSPDRAGDLKKLGLPPEWAAYSGLSFDSDPFKDPAFRKQFFSHITPARIAFFYTTHPGRLLPPLAIASANLFDVRLSYLGNFTRDSKATVKSVLFMPSAESLPAGTRWKWPLLRVFMTWSETRARIMPGKTWFWMSAAVFAATIGLVRARRCARPQSRITGATLVALAVMFLLVPPTCIAGDGTFEIRKHLFLGCVIFDLILLLLLESILSIRSVSGVQVTKKV